MTGPGRSPCHRPAARPAFPAILVYAQELFPAGWVAISGLFFGLAFGLAGIGALLGQLADRTSIGFKPTRSAPGCPCSRCAVFPGLDLRGREQEAAEAGARPA